MRDELKRMTLRKRIMLKLEKSLSNTVQKLWRKRKQQRCSQSNKWKKENPRKKEEVKAYEPQVSFPLQKAKLEEQFSRFLDMFKKIEINIPFS